MKWMVKLLCGLTVMMVAGVTGSGVHVHSKPLSRDVTTQYTFREEALAPELTIRGYVNLDGFAVSQSGEKFALIHENGRVKIYQERGDAWVVTHDFSEAYRVGPRHYRWEGAHPTFAWGVSKSSCEAEGCGGLSVARYVDGRWAFTRVLLGDLDVPVGMELMEFSTSASGATVLLFQERDQSASCVVRWEADFAMLDAPICGLQVDRDRSWIDAEGTLRFVEAQSTVPPYVRVVEKTLRGTSLVESAVLDDSTFWLGGGLGFAARGNALGATVAWETVDPRRPEFRRVLATRLNDDQWEQAREASSALPFDPFLRDVAVGTEGQGCLILQGGRGWGPLRGVIGPGHTWNTISRDLDPKFLDETIESASGCTFGSGRYSGFLPQPPVFFNESGALRPIPTFSINAISVWNGSTFVTATPSSPAAGQFVLSARVFNLESQPKPQGKVRKLKIVPESANQMSIRGKWKPPADSPKGTTYKYRVSTNSQVGKWISTSKTKTRRVSLAPGTKVVTLDVRVVSGATLGPIASASYRPRAR